MVASLHQLETTDPLPSAGPSTRSEVGFILQLETSPHAKSTTGRNRLLASARPNPNLGALVACADVTRPRFVMKLHQKAWGIFCEGRGGASSSSVL